MDAGSRFLRQQSRPYSYGIREPPVTVGHPSLRPRLRVGISSWGDLPGFYPSGVRSGDRLGWYARFYSLVEVNTSYYAILPERNYLRWAEGTPDEFLFDVKAFSDLSSSRMLPDAALFASFRASYKPLRDAGKMGAVLFQFSPSFTNSPRSRDHLALIAEQMTDETAVIEFRHYSWLGQENANETLTFLAELGLAYAVADEPQIPRDTVPPLPAVTDPDLAYVRLHGRNAAGWYRGRSDRYDYDYSDAELLEWTDIINSLADDAREVHVLFNNNAKGAGTRNALTLANLLGVAEPNAPAPPPTQTTLFGDDAPPEVTR